MIRQLFNKLWRSKDDLTQYSNKSAAYQSTTEKKDKEETLLASLLSHFGIWHGVATFFGTSIPFLSAIGLFNHFEILSDSQAHQALMPFALTVPLCTASGMYLVGKLYQLCQHQQGAQKLQEIEVLKSNDLLESTALPLLHNKVEQILPNNQELPNLFSTSTYFLKKKNIILPANTKPIVFYNRIF